MNDHYCGRVFALLSEYLDRELAPETCEELEEHLRGCPECIEFVHSLRRSVQLCRRFGNCRPLPAIDSEAMTTLQEAYGKMLERRQRASGSAG